MGENLDIISGPAFASLADTLDSLRSSLSQWLATHGKTVDDLLWARVYMTDPANQVTAVRQHPLYHDFLAQTAFSYIGQPLLNGARMALMFSTASHGDVEKEGTPQRKVLRCGHKTMLMHSVRLSDDEAQGLTPQQQTELIFQRHIDWLQQRGLTLRDNCVRTWLYVRDIDHNYAGVVRGRNEVFVQQGLTKDSHFIASTGIGGYTDSTQAVVAIDFLSVEATDLRMRHLNALDYLNHTHEYGVAFERGVLLQAAQDEMVFISGTASIDKHGKCLYVGDTPRQIERLFVNIEQLLKDANRSLNDITCLTVYLRDIADVRLAEQYVRQRFPNVPCVIVEACVCRPQWLVEVECVAR